MANRNDQRAFPITDAALRWLEVILAERFGQAWQLARTAEGLRLQLAGEEGAILFDTLCEGFTQAHSDQPFTRWDAEREGWSSVLGGRLPAPGVAALPSPLIEPHGAAQVIHYDILGLTYWMLARVEEIGRTDLDNHARFPATASHAFKHGYLDRPVVDEWLHLFGQVIKRQWPGVELKRHTSRTLVSCDVDSPFALDRSFSRMTRRMVGDLLRRRSFSASLKTFAGFWQARRGDYSLDAHRQGIRFIMDSSERVDRAAAFYFIPENTDPILDNRVSLDDPRMRALLREIHARGHEIGIHPGYNTYRHPVAITRSVQTLRRVLDEEGIVQPLLGGRQHYLRWETPTTARLWDVNGLDYDSTLGYADHIGFRAGTSHNFLMFDAKMQRILSLYQKPLVVMDVTVFRQRYMGLSADEGAKVMADFKRKHTLVGGEFNLLWHNHNLNCDEYKDVFSGLLI